MDPVAEYNRLSCALCNRLEYNLEDLDDDLADDFRAAMDAVWWGLTPDQTAAVRRDSYAIDHALFDPQHS